MPRARKSLPDVVIVGGGVVGCGVAWELGRSGARVLVLERSVPGAEASSHAAGILGAQVEAHGPSPLFELCLRSRAAYAAWARDLGAATGIDVEHRPCGVLVAALSRSELSRARRRYAFQKKNGQEFSILPASKLRARVHALTEHAVGGVEFDRDARVAPRRLLRALRVAAEMSGVRFQTGAYVRSVASERGRVQGVVLDGGAMVPAKVVVVAAGSWSSLVGGVALPPGGVVPARGQIVELRLPVPAFSPVLFGPGCYLVPRDDGRVIVGSTLEFVGYQRDVTAGAVRDLLAAAIELVPALETASVERSWSSFRPHTSDGLPVLGNADVEGLVIATGHHKNGILLAPITAKIIRALVLGQRSPVDISAFSPGRGGRA